MDDAAFHPLPDIEPIYDAVYNARLSPQKRPQLAVEIERLALTYYTPSRSSQCRNSITSVAVARNDAGRELCQ